MSYPPLPSNGETSWGTKFISWADALEGRKVEGEGMALRYDTSVGTRVFLDHPGGSTMIHGDTGWRQVSEYLHDHVAPGSFGARLRIEGTTAHLIINGATIGTSRVGQLLSNTVAIFNMPPGTLPRQPYSPALGTITHAQHNGFVRSRAYLTRLDGFFPHGTGIWPEDGDISVYASWEINTWPSTLFGTPI